MSALGICIAFAACGGRVLVSDHPDKSDVIVVLAGDDLDVRYRKGKELLRAGYGNHLFLDASGDTRYFGHSPAEYAAEFLKEDAADLLPRITVCPFSEDSTITETKYVAECLGKLQPKSVLLVTSDFHSGRAFSVFRKKLPQYRWSVAAVYDQRLFGTQWWRRREWAKTALEEWLRLIWWTAVDRWN